MGRHSRDEDPAPGRADRPGDWHRPVTGGPAGGAHPPRQPAGGRPVQPGRPLPTVQPFPPRPAGALFRPQPAPQACRPQPFPPRPATEPRRPDSTASRSWAAGEDTGSRRAVTDTGSRRAITDTGSRRAVTDTGTGYHRAIGKTPGRRRIATWPLVSAGFVVLLVVGLLGWSWANSVVNNRAEAQANGCPEGNETMNVLVTPAVQKPVEAAATRWNQAMTVVHSHCIHVDVTPMASDRTLDALTGRNNLDSIGGLPAAWIAENAAVISQLQAAKPAMIAAPAESIASAPSADYQYVGLTGTTLDEVQARAAQVFRDYLRDPAQRSAFTAAGLTTTPR
ncbi:MAG TPA: hypothetical protein VJ870_16785 [Amycolatopsis sp.]|nr:hypothetical protein [Amycolatopsis sp.]